MSITVLNTSIPQMSLMRKTRYCKRKKFQGVKFSWFFNSASEVKFHGFCGSWVFVVVKFIHKVKWCYSTILITKQKCHPLEN